MFLFEPQNAHSARDLLGGLCRELCLGVLAEYHCEPVPARAADAQARERVAVLEAAGVAAAVAERNAGHKRGQHGQPPTLAKGQHGQHDVSSDSGSVHCSETRGCLRKYEMIINSPACSLMMY